MSAARGRYMPVATETLLAASEAARILACSPDTVRNMWDAGEMPYVRLRADRRVKYVDLMAWIDANTKTPRGTTSIPLTPSKRSAVANTG